ncbi:MAG: ribosome silencing factor [Lachnospiraceae bacterium]|nr:ribosome silencing factor [Lachnospiraceae bacterium]
MSADKDNSTRLARIAIDALESKKAVDVRIIDISEVSVLADYMIIAGGNNTPQIQALADAVTEAIEKAGTPIRQTEGYDAGNWVLLDFGDIIVHVFDAQNRLLYDLERIWRDGKQIDPETI